MILCEVQLCTVNVDPAQFAIPVVSLTALRTSRVQGLRRPLGTQAVEEGVVTPITPSAGPGIEEVVAAAWLLEVDACGTLVVPSFVGVHSHVDCVCTLEHTRETVRLSLAGISFSIELWLL